MINPPQRSPRAKVGGLVHFGRMLDKIRAHARGELPVEYHPNLGLSIGLDGFLCAFLNIPFEEVRQRTLEGGADEEILEWCFARSGFRPTKMQGRIWNEFARKYGWNDAASRFIDKACAEESLPRENLPGAFDVIDFREGRASASAMGSD
jgi:hypothetical protein